MQMRDGGNLLTLAGLALPAVDTDGFVLHYPGGPAELVQHLRVGGVRLFEIGPFWFICMKQ